MYQLAEVLLILFIFIGIPVFVAWYEGKPPFDKKQQMLEDIRDELRKQNNQNEVKEGRVIK